MNLEMANLSNLISVADQFLIYCRERMVEQRAWIKYLADEGQDTDEAQKLVDVFGDMEEKFVEYRAALESKLMKKRNA